jgi:hypothetical protein
MSLTSVDRIFQSKPTRKSYTTSEANGMEKISLLD